jgi:hypothetical protein
VLLGIELIVLIGSQIGTQVDVVAVAAQTVSIVGFDYDGSFLHLLQNALVA